MPYVEYDEVELVCTDCGRAFRTDEALSAHRADAHAGLGGAGARPAAAHSVRCSLCGHAFPSVSALARHNRSAHVS